MNASLPREPQDEVIYVLPTKVIDGADGVPAYSDAVRSFPKRARASNVAAEFSHSGTDRKFVSEYSAVSTAEIALALIGPVTDAVLFAVQLFLAHRASNLGVLEEAAQHQPLRLSIARIDRSAQVIEGVELEGTGEDVIAALRATRDLLE